MQNSSLNCENFEFLGQCVEEIQILQLEAELETK